MHPIFGDIKDSTPSKPSMKMYADLKAQKKSGSKKTFTTSALQIDCKVKDAVKDTEPNVQRVHIMSDSALKKPCIFCKGEHGIESCRKMRSKPHKEKIDFLQRKGLYLSKYEQKLQREAVLPGVFLDASYTSAHEKTR